MNRGARLSLVVNLGQEARGAAPSIYRVLRHFKPFQACQACQGMEKPVRGCQVCRGGLNSFKSSTEGREGRLNKRTILCKYTCPIILNILNILHNLFLIYFYFNLFFLQYTV